MSTFAGTDDCTDILLDFISGGVWGDKLGNPIGEADGNYNAVIGYVHATQDLSAMSLDQIYALEVQLLDEGEPSTAVGRYQFLRATLRLLQAKRGLPGSTLFTPKLQDAFAVDLLVGRGYPSWWLGHLPDAAFGHNLSMEWASLPDPWNGGHSHYDGDQAGNHASTSDAHLYDMLSRARAAKPA